MALQLLSTLDKNLRDRRPTAEVVDLPKGPQPILDQSELVELMEGTIEARRVKDAGKYTDEAAYRRRTLACRWPIDSLIGTSENGDPKTNREDFPKIVEAALEGMLATLRNQQPNGDWRPLTYEHDKARLDSLTYLRLAVQFVDVLGKSDLQYDNGKPIANVKVNVNNSLPAEVIEALKNRGGSDPALADFLAAQARLMNAQAAEAEARSSAPPRNKGGRPKKVPATLGLEKS